VINAELTLRPEPDSDPLIVLVSVVALATGNDEPRVLSIWADITGQRALEQRLAAASRLESIGQLAAGIAHEINTPMQYIGDNGAFLGKAYESVFGLVDGLVELAAGGGIEASRVEQLMKEAKVDLLRRRIPVAAEQVTDGVGTVSQIVRSLKTFAHPGGDEVEPVDIVEVVESTVTVSRAVWRGVADVDLDLDGQPLLIRAVPGMINQVVLNLVVNAAHAIEDRRSSGDQRPGSIVIATSAAERMVELSVGDNGGGIPGEVRDRVYDQFVTTKAVGRGTGQGLAICHNIITGNGGTIDFTTGPAGTTFTVCLPRWED
jgi:C4-dicarboxylate-specific signal transduction histidine kinase